MSELARCQSTAEDQNAQAQAQMQQQAMQAEQAANLDLQKFNREDETKRYIAELNAETIRITEDQKAAGAQSIDDDTEGLAKFEAELGIKNKALDQDMIKHNDSMSKKDKELAIKSKQANKSVTNK